MNAHNPGSVSYLAAAFLLAASVPLSAEQHPNQVRGFKADQLYQGMGEIDHVNLFNGNLTITIPIGQRYPVGGALSYGLALVWSGNVWDVRDRSDGAGGEWSRLDPGQQFNAGLGWRLSLGQLFLDTSPNNPNPTHLWVGPDGVEHVFNQRLHPTDPEDGEASVHYTRDGTYLRLKVGNGASPTIEFPDGTIHTFHPGGLLKRIEDRFGNFLNVTYGTNLWTLTDSHGRVHRVRFRSTGSAFYPQVVERVELLAFGPDVTPGNPPRATYTFTTADTAVSRPCLAPGQTPDPFNQEPVYVPLLTRVELPDGSAYSMPVSHYVLAPPGPPANPCTGVTGQGHLQGLDLPTLARLEWVYTGVRFPTSSAPGDKPQFQRATGVAQRHLRDAGMGLVGSWVYTHELHPIPSNETPGPAFNPAREKRTLVRTPLGDTTVHYFSAFSEPGPFPPWDTNEYGLPLSRERNDGTSPGRFLSSEVFDCTTSGTNCQLRRTSYVRYERDHPDGGTDSNRREVSARTVFHDDGNRVADVARSNFDGLGHYRTVQATDSFALGPTRTETTQWNWPNGTFTLGANGLPLPGFTMVQAHEPWVLEERYFHQLFQNGFPPQFVLFCTDATTGLVLGERRLAGPQFGVGPTDLLTTYAYQGGNLTQERFFGGDVQALSTAGGACDTGSLPDQYRIEHTYQFGNLATSQYRDASGGASGPLAFFAVQRTIDRNTGLPSSSTDSAGARTNFIYDAMGRITLEAPAAGDSGRTAYSYTRALGQNTPAVAEIHRQNSSATAVLAAERYTFDHLGRVSKEEQHLPTGWQARVTTYNALGWKATVSEQGTTGEVTQFQDHDPFGRPRELLAPDGKQVTLLYAGVRSVTRQVKVGTGRTAEGAVIEETVSTTELYDAQGQLRKVIEPPPAGTGPNRDTTYEYDTGGRLSKVTQTAPEGTQTRLFTYDGRGLLLSEQHPEKGSFGNGTVTYSRYNARGHAERKVDGPNALSFAYDRAERLVQVSETNSGRLLKELTYGTGKTAADRSAGKVKTATRHNWHDRFAMDVVVTETSTYGGKDGRVSQRDTIASTGPSFTQSWTYTDLGLPATVTYPACLHADCVGKAPARTVSSSYSFGYLSAVPGYASAITYHPNGLVAQVSHANGVNWMQENDPDGMRRPRSIRLTGAVTSGVLGPYTYDGAGNMAKVGTGEDYLYDRWSRVVRGTFTNGPRQDYTFDSFGNLTQIMTTQAGGTPQCPPVGNATCRTMSTVATTNRLSAAGYDGAGNQTGWGGLTYGFDALNMLRSLQGGGNDWLYVYTADDERIWSFDFAANQSRWRVRDLSGKVLREYVHTGVPGGTVWSWGKDYVHRDDQLLASVSPTEGTRHLHADHLGTPRIITTQSPPVQTIEQHHYFPFGEELAAVQSGEVMKFTGHERDYNSTGGTSDDLEYMHARYCSPHTGRFLNVDPSPRSADPDKPSSWNRYSYANGNPMLLVDPTGENATVTCDPDQNCLVAVEAQIVADPNDSRQMQAAVDFKQSAERYWANQAVTAPTGEKLKFSVNFTIVAPSQQQPGMDTLTVASAAGRSNVQMALTPGSQTASPPDRGTIFTSSTSNNPSGMRGIAPHETGHLMGLRDRYRSGERVPLNSSPAGDIMRYAQPTNRPHSAHFVLDRQNGNTVIVQLPGPPRP